MSGPSKSSPSTDGAIQTLTFKGTPLEVGAGTEAFVAPVPLTILGVAADTDNVDAVLDVHKNGTTIFTDQGLRRSLSTGNGYFGTEAIPDVVALAAGDRLTVDIDSIGSPGGNYVSSGGFITDAGAGTFTLWLPTGIVGGDMLLASVALGGPAAMVITPPAGWAEIGTGVTDTGGAPYEIHLYWKRAAGTVGEATTEPASWDFTYTNSAAWLNGQVHGWRDIIASGDPTDGVATYGPVTGTSHTVPSLTPTTVASLRVVFCPNANTPPGGLMYRTVQISDRKLAGLAASGTDVLTTANLPVMAIATLLKTTPAVPASSVGHVHIRYRVT